MQNMQNTPILPLLPSASFLSTLHSDLDCVPITEASIFKTAVTDNNLELSFEVDCTRETIKTQTTSLTLPKDLRRTLEKEFEKNKFHPLKDSKGIMVPYSRDINHYGVWWVEDMFSKHADSFSKKPEVFNLTDFKDLILPPIQENDNDESQSSHQNIPFSNYRCSPIEQRDNSVVFDAKISLT